MAQEITVIVMVDIAQALANNSLGGHIYLFDNLRTTGSKGLGTEHLTSKINGSHWSDRSQASEHILNWLPFGITAPSPSLPAIQHEATVRRNQQRGTQVVQQMISKMAAGKKAEATDVSALTGGLDQLTRHTGVPVKMRDSRGVMQDTGQKLTNHKGELFASVEEAQAAPVGAMTYITPIITGLTGEAVDNGVIFPSQYGTPIPINSGWYWAATADTSKVGRWSYTLHFTLFDLKFEEGEAVWERVPMTHRAHVEVSSLAMRNGFTHGGATYLPVTQPRPIWALV